ncbi:MAG: alpha/beta hydrolase [Parvibaculum sp.]|nr:alpha/beta hydrolase [Parvibaculum sp.]
MTALLLVVLLLAASLVLYSSWASLRATRTWPPEGGFVVLGGAFGGESLHYVDRGEARAGIAPVVLIHGASGNLRDMTQSLVGPLSRKTRVIAIDRPGHGWSARTAHPDIADPAVQAGAIHEGLSRLGVVRPVILGHSWGASVAAAYALEFPGDLSGLVALSGALYPWPGGIAWYHTLVRAPLAGWLFLRMLIVPGGKILMEKGVQMNFHPDPAPSDFAATIGLPLLFRPDEFRANSEDTAGLKAHLARQSRHYGAISAPTIVVTGNADYTVSPKLHSYAFHGAVAGSELVKLKGTGHMPHHARRDLVLDAILRLARGERPHAGMTTIHEDGRVERAAAG